MESVLYVLSCVFLYGQCALCVVVWFYLWIVSCIYCGVVLYGQCAVFVEVWPFLLTECCMCFGVVFFLDRLL